MAPDLLASAEQALELAQSEPARARELAHAVLARGRGASDAVAVSVAHRTLGQIATALEDLSLAAEHLRSAYRFARRAGDDRRAAEACMSHALVLVQQGRAAAALRKLNAAATALVGTPDEGRLLNQRAAVLHHLGRFTEARAAYDAGLVISRRASDHVNVVRLLSNRGVLLAGAGDHAGAERDLQKAASLAEERALGLIIANIHQNLGWLAARQANIPLALERYDTAQVLYKPQSEPMGTLLLDRCDVLMTARLLPEAKQSAELALAAFRDGGLDALAAEAQLYLAEVALLDNDPAAAAASARAASTAFRRQRRTPWTALARYAEARAGLAGHSADPLRARRTTAEVARALDRAGWRVQALDLRVAAAQLALDGGRPDLARRDLHAAAGARRHGSVEVRTRAWHAEALLRRANGDRKGTRAALNAGLRLAEDYRAALGASDLRAAATGHRVELARLGFRVAYEDGRAADALRWVERYRARLLRTPLARPPDDPELAADLASLRTTIVDLEDAIRDDADDERQASLARRQRELEGAVRDRYRHRSGRSDETARLPTLTELGGRLAHRALIEFVAVDEQIFAITFVDGRARIVPIGELQTVSADVDALLVLLRRLAGRHGTPAGRAAAVSATEAVAARLDARLLAPLRPFVGDRELVLVPTGVLHPVPWSLLPGLRGQPVAVVPSASAWYAAGRTPADATAHDVIVVGPGLPGAAREGEALRQHYPDAAMLTGDAATAAATLAALDGARIAHLAVHCELRRDNPLFSSLRLHDGPLTVYDLERIERVPRTVVLSACESARAAVHPGDDQIGVGAALLGLGADVLIASVVAVPDIDAVPFMVDFHDRLIAGERPATALAGAQLQVGDDLRSADRDVAASALAVAGFICLGAG